MSIVVTGATGHLGRLTVQALLARGVEPGEIVATGRDTARLTAFAQRGVQTRRADFADPASLEQAFAGATAVVLVSTNEVGTRVANHQHAIDAAKAAGVSQLVYTSAPYAETSPMTLVDEHRETEHHLQASGVPCTVLRNGWYWENYTAQLPVARAQGGLVGSAGDGLISGAARADYAEAAAAVVTTDGHLGAIYELGGEPAVTMSDIAAAFGAALGQEITYTDLPAADYEGILRGAGVPDPMPAVLADVDVHVRDGWLFTDSGDLQRLIGHPTTPLADVVRDALAAG